MKTPPKNRHFLACIECYAWKNYRWKVIGQKWIEAFWDGKEYRQWCGVASTFTTETFTMITWKEL